MAEGSEGPKKITRRDFLKYLGAAIGLGGLGKITKQELAKASSTTFPSGPGEFLPKIEQSESTGISQKSEIGALPEKETRDRVWKKENPVNSPPPAYRSSMVYDSKGDRFVLHGGYAYGENHGQTWAYKDGNWQKLEEGSTPGLHGHKMVETPEGLLIFGGSRSLASGDFDISNEFFLFKEDESGARWEKIVPELQWGREEVPAIQAMGMVYNPNTESVWILAGATTNLALCDVTYELKLPGVWTPESGWYFRGVGYKGDASHNYDELFEPLAFFDPEDPRATYLYGGIGYDKGGGVGVYSNNLWRIEPIKTSIEVTLADWKKVDYAGVMRGGYDEIRKQLVLHSGRPMFFIPPPYQESVQYDKETDSWSIIVGGQDPPSVGRPTVAMNPKTGKVFRFGGSYYDENHEAQYSNETWRCNPLHKVYLPKIEKG